MLTRRIWITKRTKRSLDGYPGRKDTWHVKRVGWFLFGFIPLYVSDVEAQRVG